MNDLINKDQGELIKYLVGRDSAIDIPKPFERDIYLFDTFVAGTTHIENIEIIEPSINKGDKLVFYREADNPHDPQAILIETVKGEKIGYAPRQDNIIFSRLMDAGKSIFGKVIDKEKRGKWVNIKIKIYLHES